jgi:hypothetical protein
MLKSYSYTLVLASLLLIAGCSPPRYWVRGLTLPNGAIGVSVQESDGAGGIFDDKFGEVERILILGFHGAQSWDAVAEHIDACMVSAGFSSEMGGLERAGLAVHPDKPIPLASMVRSYKNPARRMAAVLVNNAGIKLAVAQFSPGGTAPRSRILSTQDFALTIIQYR